MNSALPWAGLPEVTRARAPQPAAANITTPRASKPMTVRRLMPTGSAPAPARPTPPSTRKRPREPRPHWSLRQAYGSQDVHRDVDDDPHDVDEVPVDPTDL